MCIREDCHGQSFCQGMIFLNQIDRTVGGLPMGSDTLCHIGEFAPVGTVVNSESNIDSNPGDNSSTTESKIIVKI